MARVLILSGGREPYVDPWHPYAATSGRLAAIALERGHVVELSDDPIDRIAGGLDGVDVLVSNLPDPGDVVPQEDRERAWAELDRFEVRGGGVLGVHVGLTGLLGWPRWSHLMGARWVNGASGHPPLGEASVRTLPHRLTDGVGEFTLTDELYTGLEATGDIASGVDHTLDGVVHHLVWTRRVGPVRAVGDALGHGVESFASAPHAAIVGRALDWLGAA